MCYGGLLFKEEKSSKGLLSGTKVVFFWSDFYKTWSSRKIGDTGLPTGPNQVFSESHEYF